MRMAILALAATALIPGRPAPAAEPLVRGDDIHQFELVQIGPETISIVDGEVRLTGKPNGYFATKDEYKDYVLTFEWMYERPEGLESDAAFKGNSGLLVHLREPHKVWPQCIEVQLFHGDTGHIFGIFGSKFQGKKDPEKQKSALKPIGEWNAMEVTCKGDAIVCKVNSVEVARGEGADPASGKIAWQSEGAPIRFRKLEIRPAD